MHSDADGTAKFLERGIYQHQGSIELKGRESLKEVPFGQSFNLPENAQMFTAQDSPFRDTQIAEVQEMREYTHGDGTPGQQENGDASPFAGIRTVIIVDADVHSMMARAAAAQPPSALGPDGATKREINEQTFGSPGKSPNTQARESEYPLPDQAPAQEGEQDKLGNNSPRIELNPGGEPQ